MTCLSPALWRLCLAQALYWSGSILGISLSAIVGRQLAPWAGLATAPLALLVIGSLLSVGRVAVWLQRLGARRALQRGALCGLAGGLLACWAVLNSSFALFNLAMLLVGIYQASAGYYRFVALDGVPVERQGRAAALVVAGGILAALLAPSIADQSQLWLSRPLAGAYLGLALLAALALALLQGLPIQPGLAASAAQPSVPKAVLWRRADLRQALLLTACAHGLMILAMNATPLAMSAQGHHLSASTQVIQWHVLGMFAPSLLAGYALDRWGDLRVGRCGLLLLFGSVAMALAGQQPAWFLGSSLLLGLGWNLLFLSGTRRLAAAHAPAERRQAQALMEWLNYAAAALMSLGSGALMHLLGWQAIHAAMLPLLLLMAWWLRPDPAPAQ